MEIEVLGDAEIAALCEVWASEDAKLDAAYDELKADRERGAPDAEAKWTEAVMRELAPRRVLAAEANKRIAARNAVKP